MFTKPAYKKIIVTGGTGLVGSALKSIAGEYAPVEFVFGGSRDCDLVIASSVNEYVRAIEPDAIIHLAANCGGIGLSMNQQATTLRDNVLMNINVLEAARANGVKKTVMSLSTGMYPAEVSNPIKESYIHDGPPHASNYGYSFAKRLVEPLIRSYRGEYGMNVIGLVPNGIFGERCNYNYNTSTMLPALIRRFYEGREGTDELVVWGDGSPLREYTYAEDMARAYMWCLNNYNDEQILHVGTTEEHSVKEMAYMVGDILGIDRNRIVFDTSKPAGQHRKNTDNSLFLEMSNFQYTPFKKALKKTIDWFCAHYGDETMLRL